MIKLGFKNADRCLVIYSAFTNVPKDTKYYILSYYQIPLANRMGYVQILPLYIYIEKHPCYNNNDICFIDLRGEIPPCI